MSSFCFFAFSRRSLNVSKMIPKMMFSRSTRTMMKNMRSKTVRANIRPVSWKSSPDIWGGACEARAWVLAAGGRG